MWEDPNIPETRESEIGINLYEDRDRLSLQVSEKE